MKEAAPESAVLPTRLPALAVLGLSTPESEDWRRLRAFQYSAHVQGMKVRVGAQLVAAALVAVMMAQPVGLVATAAWVLAFLLSGGIAMRQTLQLSNLDRAGPDRREFYSHLASYAAMGVVWAMPILLVGVISPEPTLFAIWAVVATLLAGAALLMPALPAGTVMMCVTTGTAGVIAAVLAGEPLAGLGVVMFVAIIGFGAIQTARTFMVARIAEAQISEKDDVVSLLLREFEENQADWLWQIDVSRRVRAVSPRFSFALGMAPQEVNGMPFLELIAGESWKTGQFTPSLHELAERLKRKESFSNLIVRVTIQGENRWWELSGTPIIDDDGQYQGFRGVGSDVTEQRESNEKIAYLARYDTLTGLPNRLMLTEALRDALKFADQWRTRCAFLMLDLDRFKAVNDSLGHMVGDQLLAQVSNRLKELTDDNALCGRLGGDEFAIVVRDASDKGVINRLALKLIARLSQPYDIDNHTLYVGASVGSAVGPVDGSSVEELMRNADLALYRAKDEGGGEHREYEPSLHRHAEERRQLEFSLRRAIDRGELALHFQPVVDAADEHVVSFEALVRWNSSDHGSVSPVKFIPVAEDTRLIVPIGTWVLRQACMEAASWPKNVKVAVNVSGEQLLDPNFPNEVVRALADSGLEARRLEVEVTESVFLRDPDMARGALEQVIALGCSIALDDFGTGYSSLGYLRQLKFSTIKVDRTFVQGAAQNSAESLAIIRAVVAMADSLGMSTTAEGVEGADEAELVRKLGCRKIQGFYFGRPMPADEVQQVFERRRSA